MADIAQLGQTCHLEPEFVYCIYYCTLLPIRAIDLTSLPWVVSSLRLQCLWVSLMFGTFTMRILYITNSNISELQQSSLFFCPKTKWALTKRMESAGLNFILHLRHPPVHSQLTKPVEKSFLFHHGKMTFSPVSFRPIVIPHGSRHLLIVHFFRSGKEHQVKS